MLCQFKRASPSLFPCTVSVAKFCPSAFLVPPSFWSGRASEPATTTALKRKSTSTAEDEFRWHHPSFAMPTLGRKKGFLASRIRDHDRYYSGKQSYPSTQPFPNPHGGAPSLGKAAALICAVNRFFLRKQDALSSLSRFPPFVIVHSSPSLSALTLSICRCRSRRGSAPTCGRLRGSDATPRIAPSGSPASGLR